MPTLSTHRSGRRIIWDMIYGTITPSTMRLSNISTFRHIFSLLLPLDKLMFL